MQTLHCPFPLLPVLLHSLPHVLDLMLFDLISDCHMWSETIILLIDDLGEFSCGDFVDFL